MSDIDTAVVDSLKVLDLKRPIREADIQSDWLRIPALTQKMFPAMARRASQPVRYACSVATGISTSYTKPVTSYFIRTTP